MLSWTLWQNNTRIATGSAEMSWEVVGYDSTSEICRFKISGRYGEKRLGEILRRLVCRDLESYEIIEASTGGRSILDVHRDSKSGTLMCGSNPHYVARWIAAKS